MSWPPFAGPSAAAAGAFYLSVAPTQLIARVIGVAVLAFAAIRSTGRLKVRGGSGLLMAGRRCRIAFRFDWQRRAAWRSGHPIDELEPPAYVVTEAVTAVGMHAVKMIVYRQRLRFNSDFWPLALGLSAAMFAGAWVAKRFVDRFPRAAFQALVSLLLVLVGLQMILST